MRKRIYILFTLAFCTLASCIYPYSMDVSSEDNIHCFVMDGYIECGGYSYFSIRRSIALDNAPDTSMYSIQSIYIEDDKGNTYIGENSKNIDGTSIPYNFTVDTRYIDPSNKYRFVAVLEIYSSGFLSSSSYYAQQSNPFYETKTYHSDFVEVSQTPDIDALTYSIAQDGLSVDICIDTHGSAGETDYYKWSYVENWEFTARVNAFYVYDPSNSTIHEGSVPFYCWSTYNSSEIILYDTQMLAENKVDDFVLKTIPYTDDRISYLYSIEVSQKKISKDAYYYWETLRKNNDETGGLFSPQPSELKGNIVCVEDSTEEVLGYIGCGTISRAQIYIDERSLGIYEYPFSCEGKFLDASQWKTAYLEGWSVVNFSDDVGGGFWWMKNICVDCSYRANSVRPSWWPIEY